MKYITLLAALLAALLTTATAASAAPRYSNMPILYDLGNSQKPNMVMARLIQQSLDVKSDGTAIIQGSPCTTPADLLAEIAKFYPNEGITSVDQLPKFYAHLIARKASAEGLLGKKYNMMRMECHAPDHRVRGDMPNPVPYARELRLDEWVFYIPNRDGLPFAAADCFNILEPDVALPPPPPPPPPPVVTEECNYLTVTFKSTAHAHTRVVANRPFQRDAVCHGMKAGKGEVIRYDQCPLCVFDDAMAELRDRGYKAILQPGGLRLICEVPDAHGYCHVTIRLPRSASGRQDDDMFLWCLDYGDGNTSRTSVVDWRSFDSVYHHAYLGGMPDDDPIKDTWAGVMHTWQ